MRAAVTASGKLIARGNGRSYGDPALNRDTTLILSHADRFLAFDPQGGRLEAEAGVMLADIIETFLPRGWFIPVTPGTKFVTLGGMIAADVHGKNHHKEGSIGDHIESLELMLADGRVVRCSPLQNPELVQATRGGMGLTGVILSAVLRMKKVESAYIRQETLRTSNLDETMAAFEQSLDWTYSVAWIDCFARGARLGRALLYRGEHARLDELPPDKRPHPFAVTPNSAKRVPFDFPGFALNRWSVKLFNAFYYAAGSPGPDIVNYDRYFYPLDAILDWNRIYGASGLLQYQCVLPKATSREGMAAILERVARASSGSFLSVLKLLGPGSGMMSFPLEGYTIALDFPANAQSFALLDELDAMVAARGGRVYLAKDARMNAAMLRQGYAGFDAFEKVRQAVDPSGKFASLQSERLKL